MRNRTRNANDMRNGKCLLVSFTIFLEVMLLICCCKCMAGNNCKKYWPFIHHSCTTHMTARGLLLFLHIAWDVCSKSGTISPFFLSSNMATFWSLTWIMQSLLCSALYYFFGSITRSLIRVLLGYYSVLVQIKKTPKKASRLFSSVDGSKCTQFTNAWESLLCIY